VTAPDEVTVAVPRSLAAATFNALSLYLDALRSSNGGALSPEARKLLHDLNCAASQPVSPTKPAGEDPDTVMLGMGTVAALLGCSPQYARRLASCGSLPGAQRVGRIWLVPSTSLDAFRHERQEDAHGESGRTPQADPQ
jgi:hypothetical protein